MCCSAYAGARFAAYVDLSKFTGILSATREKAFMASSLSMEIVSRMDAVWT